MMDGIVWIGVMQMEIPLLLAALQDAGPMYYLTIVAVFVALIVGVMIYRRRGM